MPELPCPITINDRVTLESVWGAYDVRINGQKIGRIEKVEGVFVACDLDGQPIEEGRSSPEQAAKDLIFPTYID